MNQILVTNDENIISPKGFKPVIRFFAIVAIVFAIVLIIEGGIQLYTGLNKNKDYAKPQLTYEKNGSSIIIKLNGDIGLNRIVYSWNGGSETTVSADGKKSINHEIEIPQGDSKLALKAKDVEGHETKFEDIIITFTEDDDTVKPEINIENANGKLAVTAKDDKEIDYLTYQWEGSDEVKIEGNEQDKTTINQTLNVEKGTKKLTVVAVDKAGNKTTVNKKIIGSNGPTIAVTLDSTKENFVIKVTDEYGITKIEYTLNDDETKTVEGIPENTKEFEFKVSLKDGLNKLIIDAYENGIMTEYKCKRTK